MMKQLVLPAVTIPRGKIPSKADMGSSVVLNELAQ